MLPARVWLSTRDIHLRLPCHKLRPRYIGLFTMQSQLNEVTYSLNLLAQYSISPLFHISLLKPFTEPLLSPLTGSGDYGVPPTPEIADAVSIFWVRPILNLRQQGNILEYLFDWEGYGPEERSWVARDDILDPSLLT